MTAARLRALRQLGRFFVLGALLLGVRHLVMTPPAAASAPLEVTVAEGADATEVARVVTEAALVDLALRARWPMGDPVVRDLLLAAMRADDPEGDAEKLIARGVVLGMTRRDPATRARLAWLGREIVRSRVRTAAPSPALLAAYREAHAERYAGGWLILRQKIISRARHGEKADIDARALAQTLAGADADAKGGDPSLLPAHLSGTPALIDARFGPGFAAALAGAPTGRWSGPFSGSFGQHLVWLESRTASGHSAAALEARVLRDWHQDQLEREMRREIERLVRRRQIALRRGAP